MTHREKFDVLRGVSALAVLFSHIFQVFWVRFLGEDHSLNHFWLTFGRHAVLVFFLLSSYLITLSIIENTRRNSRFSPLDYLASRISRIHPPLAGAIVLMAVIWAAIHLLDLPGEAHYGLPGDLYVAKEKYTLAPLEIITSLLMMGGLTNANPPLWSLYIEFQLYMLALLVTVTQSSHIAAGLRALSALAATFALLVLTIHDPAFVFYACVWLLGSVSALVITAGHGERIRTLSKPLIYALVAVIFALAIGNPITLSVLRPGRLASFAPQLLFSIVYGYIVFFSDALNRVFPKILRNTGSFSYSLYVIHYPMLLLLLSVTQNCGCDIPTPRLRWFPRSRCW